MIDTTLTDSDEEDLQTYFGVDVDDVQSSVSIGDGTIFGTSKYIDSVTTFDMSLGHHFMVLHITADGADKVEVTMDPTGGMGLQELDETGVVIFQMKDDKSQKVKIVVTKDEVSQDAYYDITEMVFTEKVYTQEELEAMTIDQIKALAAERGYTITKTLKADIIAEFLTQQNGE